MGKGPHQGVLRLVYGGDGGPDVLRLQQGLPKPQADDRVLRYLQQVPRRRQACRRGIKVMLACQ